MYWIIKQYFAGKWHTLPGKYDRASQAYHYAADYAATGARVKVVRVF